MDGCRREKTSENPVQNWGRRSWWKKKEREKERERGGKKGGDQLRKNRGFIKSWWDFE